MLRYTWHYNKYVFCNLFYHKSRARSIRNHCDKTTLFNGQKKHENIDITISDVDWYTGVGINVMKNSATLWYLSEDMLLKNIYHTYAAVYDISAFSEVFINMIENGKLNLAAL